MDLDQFKIHEQQDEKHWWFLGRRNILVNVLKTIVPPSPSNLLLDIGCGVGANLSELSQFYTCIGLDISKEAIQIAKKEFPHIQFFCESFDEHRPKLKKEINICLLLDVLEHIKNDFDFLKNIIDSLIPGTHILITIPADKSLWSRHDESFGHFRRYTIEDLEILIQQLPVKTIFLSYFNSRMYYPIKIMRTLGKKFRISWGPSGTDNFMPYSWINSVLKRILSGEQKKLIEFLKGQRKKGYSYGCSLMAVLKKE